MTSHPFTARSLLIGVLAVSALVGLVSAGLATGTLGLLPPKLQASTMDVAAAQTHVLVDTRDPSMLQRRALEQDLETLVKHTELLGRVMVSPQVLDRVAMRAGLPRGSVGGSARTTTSVPDALIQPGSEQRAAAIGRSNLPYSVEVQARPMSPVIDVYTRAPSADEAKRLADAAVPGLRAYLQALAADQGVAIDEALVLRQLGAARGSAVNAGAPLAIAVIAFFLAFVLTCGALFSLLWLARNRISADVPRLPDPPQAPAGDDDWPNTTRILPWALAAFVAMLWLVPFNVIELNASLPIDITLDRLVLPLVAVAWILAFAGGGRVAPRVRFTWIHAGVGFFVTCAFLSVVLDAGYLSQTLELDLAFKKLPLLLSFASLFVITASALRPSEVPAFLNYTLILAVICAAGIIFEYRFEHNLFYEWSDKLLPAVFEVTQFDPTVLDGIGRRIVLGPGEAGLEAVAMLAMALPIALVGLLQSKTWRGRILYGLAVCVLVAATFATYRKSAVLAPVAVVLTLAYFRRRELLKLAPIGILLVVLVTVVSPGALRATVDQFVRSDRLDVPTVSDRASDYDAVRPDLWTHLIFGRGWGSYNHETYRILDSEILHRTLEMGLLGIVAFLLMGLSVILSARKTIAGRDPQRAPVALVGAAAAAGFLTLSGLFDILSFPHATLIFLYMAGIVALVIAPDEQKEAADTPTVAPALHEEGRVRPARSGRRLSADPAGSAH
jgi:hypothetical protein